MEYPATKVLSVLASTVRSATTVSDDQLNEYYVGGVFTFNIAAVPGTDTVTFVVDGKDPKSNAYYPILASTALSAGETKATGSVTLTGGASGSVNTVRVAGVNLIAAPVPFNTSLNQTATDLAAAINALTSTHGYTANAVGAAVTITAPAGSGTIPNGYTVVSTVTTITKTDVNMSGGVSGTVVLRVYPGIAASANVAASDALPRSWRVRVVHSGPGNFTYTANAQLLM